MASFWLVALLLCAYLVLIGPADYFFLRKCTRRMELTWITFPGIVILVSLAAWLLAVWFRGSEVRMNQVDLVDVDTASGWTRGTTWATVFSPRTRTFDLSARPLLPGTSRQPAAAPCDRLVGAGGQLAGRHGPANRRATALAGALRLLAGAGSDGPRAGARGVDQVALRAWQGRIAASPVQIDLKEEDKFLTGTVTNRLPCRLTHCLLAYQGLAYELGKEGTIETGEGGTIEAGETVPVDASVKCSEARMRLTGRSNCTTRTSIIAPPPRPTTRPALTSPTSSGC